MRILTIIGVIALIVPWFGLTGCAAGPPTAEQLANADYGASISQAEAEAKATEWLRGTLKDPASAQIEWSPVQQGWIRKAPIEGGRLVFGYSLNAQINAKNSFGGYNGFKPYIFLFRDRELLHVYGQQMIHGQYSSTPYMGRLK